MQVDFQILANQRDITSVIRDRLLQLRITDEAGLISDTVEIQLDDRDGQITWPEKRAELEVYLGYKHTGVVRMGLYLVDEVEYSGPPSTLTIRGKAADMRASIKAPKTRSWDQITLGNLVSSIAAEHGLSAKVSTTLAGIGLSHIDQTNESDLHLLTRLARDYGVITKPVAGFLIFVPRGEAKTASGKTLPVIHIQASDIIRHRMTQAERNQYQSVQAYWHDTDSAEKQTVTTGEDNPVYTLKHTYSNTHEAIRAAQAKLSALKRGAGTLSLTLIGNPSLQAEGKINLTGIREPIDGQWLIQRVAHQLDSQGLITRIEAETPNT